MSAQIVCALFLSMSSAALDKVVTPTKCSSTLPGCPSFSRQSLAELERVFIAVSVVVSNQHEQT